MSDRILLVLGTRPEIIKLSPVIRACEDADVPYTLVHTGQHYSETLDSVFFDRLELPEPDYNLGVASGSHGEQTGEMLIRVERVLQDESPETVLVQGDTNSVLAGALAASKLDVDLGHVEAGLRCFDPGMPEEINRVIADHVSDYLFAPTTRSEEHLLAEGLPESRISVTGNTVVDAIERNRGLAREKSTVLRDLGLERRDFFLLTAHREENVDDEDRFADLLSGAAAAAREHDRTVVYPVHPRADRRIDEFGLDVPERIRTVDPLGYLDFLRLESAADLILTDSGGVQEEACVLGVPCVTLRERTERPETVRVGANDLRGTDPDAIREGAAAMLGTDGDWRNPFGDGRASRRILREVVEEPRRVSA